MPTALAALATHGWIGLVCSLVCWLGYLIRRELKILVMLPILKLFRYPARKREQWLDRMLDTIWLSSLPRGRRATAPIQSATVTALPTLPTPCVPSLIEIDTTVAKQEAA
jgi:hypothetical protein